MRTQSNSISECNNDRLGKVHDDDTERTNAMSSISRAITTSLSTRQPASNLFIAIARSELIMHELAVFSMDFRCILTQNRIDAYIHTRPPRPWMMLEANSTDLIERAPQI